MPSASSPAAPAQTLGGKLYIKSGDGHLYFVSADVSETNISGSGFVIEDGDGTEVTITANKEVKFVEGTGLDINWTDTDNLLHPQLYLQREIRDASSTGRELGRQLLRYRRLREPL